MSDWFERALGPEKAAIARNMISDMQSVLMQEQVDALISLFRSTEAEFGRDVAMFTLTTGMVEMQLADGDPAFGGKMCAVLLHELEISRSVNELGHAPE